MTRRGIIRGLTGLAAGALLTSGSLGAFFIAWDLGAPFVPYAVFEWLIRVLPGRVVTFGLDLTLSVLRGLGLDVDQTAKTAEQVLAIATFFVVGCIVGLLFFVMAPRWRRAYAVPRGAGAGAILGAAAVAASLDVGTPARAWGKAVYGVLVFGTFLAWGWGLARLLLAAYPVPPEAVAGASGEVIESVRAAGEAEVRAISRRRFLIQMGGLAATIVVVGANVGRVIGAQVTAPATVSPNGVTQFPNAGSPVVPVVGTRPEYTPVADFYRVDIDLQTPNISATEWRLVVDGLVDNPLSLGIDGLKSGYRQVEQFATLSCISNFIGGPLIGTTLWTGTPLRDVLASAAPAAEARFARITSADGFHEEIDLALIRSDPRVLLVWAWDQRPLAREHGFPLRVFIPDRYGMKQPKWITGISLTAESKPGYWVARNWDPVAEVKMTSVIDTVAVRSLVARGGQTFVPIGGMAYSGAKGISRVELQVDDGAWQAAELRQPLSDLTWVLWRYDWPFAPGDHTLTVRAFDGQGRPQETEPAQSQQGTAATGLFSEKRTIEPVTPR